MAQWKRRRVSLAGCLLATALGCTRPAQSPDERLRQQAAADAKQLHHDLRDAGKEARQAVVAARRETGDIVAGARQGWQEGGGPALGRVDLNRAPVEQLEQLPGITPTQARRIAAHRPYRDGEALVARGILSRGEYERIRPEIEGK